MAGQKTRIKTLFCRSRRNKKLLGQQRARISKPGRAGVSKKVIFRVGLTVHLNRVNPDLPKKRRTAKSKLEAVLAFELTALAKDLERGTYHFSFLK